MTATQVALIDCDKSHVDVPDLVLPDNAAGLDDVTHDLAALASAAWEAAVCWDDEYAVKELAEVRAVRERLREVGVLAVECDIGDAVASVRDADRLSHKPVETVVEPEGAGQAIEFDLLPSSGALALPEMAFELQV